MLDQGCIFSGGVSDLYRGCNISGIIITPRCDIAQQKISTIHYLPVISFSDWETYYLSSEYQRFEIAKTEKRLLAFCNKYQLSTSIYDQKYNIPDEIVSQMLDGNPESKKIIEDIKLLKNIRNIQYCRNHIKEWSQYKTRISELIDNKMHSFYLLEDWEKKGYVVVLLREVRHLSFSMAQKLENGITERTLEEHLFLQNELARSDNQRLEYVYKCRVVSPFIEHIIQAFSYNFTRIGIDDIDKESVKKSLSL